MRSSPRSRAIALAVLLGLVAALTTTAAPAAAEPGSASAFHGTEPTRVVDTRTGLGTAAGPLAAGADRTIRLAGLGGVPATGVTAVVANLTVTDTTAASHLTAWPTDQPRPHASNLNWPAGDTRANLAVLPLSPSGDITVTNNAGTTHLLIDVVGWYDTAASDAPGLRTLPPTRVVDSRDGTGTVGEPLGPKESRPITLAGLGGVPATGVTAVVANLTVTDTTAASHLTAWPTDQPRPHASNLNWPAGDTRANLAVLPLSPSGDITVTNNAGTTDLVIDVVGWYDTAASDAPGLTTRAPFRAVDTRSGTGTLAAPLGAGHFRTVALAGTGPVPAGVSAVVANVTVTGGTSASHLTTWPSDRTRPSASNLNWPAGDTRANLAVIPLAPDGTANLFNNTGSANVVVDVVGWFTGPTLDLHVTGVGTLAGYATIRVVPRGFTPAGTELRLDGPEGPLLGTSATNPAGFEVDTTSLTNGPHTLVALATSGDRTVTTTRSVAVDNRTYDWSRVDATMQRKVDDIPLPGNALLVAHHGEVVYEQGFGTYTSETPMFIASATKWLSGAVIMRLVDRGLLRLDMPVSELLPEFTGQKGQVTLRQLLAFTSGLEPDPVCAGRAAYTLATCTATIAAAPMTAAPGAQYRYGSGHLVVAARMAEVATGTPFATLFAEELTEPLGMDDTLFLNTTNPNPAGSAISTLADYARFIEAMWDFGTHDGERYLSTAAVQQMQRDQTAGAPMVATSGIRKALGSRYGLAEWFDVLDPATGAYEVSSPGAFGFHPWIDRERDLYGVYAVYLNDDDISAGGWDVKDEVRAAVDG